MEEKKKNNGGLIVLIVILLIALLGAIGYICYEKGVFKTKKEDSKQVVETKEVELTDETIKKDLETKIMFITSWDQVFDTDSNAISGYTFRYKNEVFGDSFNNLNDDLKLRIVLDSLYNTKKFNNIPSKNDYEPDKYEISQNDVNKAYNSYFGKDIPENKDIDDKGCFGYAFDSTKNIYYKYEPTCGGTTGHVYLFYYNKYTVKNDNAYVYVNYACELDKVYADLDSTKETKYDSKDFKIDESNYKDFDEYKFTFKKDKSGNYYFVSLEKNEK